MVLIQATMTVVGSSRMCSSSIKRVFHVFTPAWRDHVMSYQHERNAACLCSYVNLCLADNNKISVFQQLYSC